MGIQGLIPFSKKATRTANIKEFKGKVAAIDTYTLIYKGAFNAADEVILNPQSDVYVKYVLKRIQQLLDVRIRPILVFDGRTLPIKAVVEEKRRTLRAFNLSKAYEYMESGQKTLAKEYFKKSLNVTHHMAKNVINAVREIGIPYIVAPYEADAQLAFLSTSGIADIVITEDSDLIVFGCSKIIFKLDANGNCCLFDATFLPAVTEFNEAYTFDRFRWMCILSGCDYLENIPGIGLATAKKLLKKTKKSSIVAVFTCIKLEPKFVLPPDYFNNFIKADNAFKYQLIFDPRSMKLMPLNPYPHDLKEDLGYCGPIFPDEIAFQQAIGNYNFNTGSVDDDFILPINMKTIFSELFGSDNTVPLFYNSCNVDKQIDPEHSCRNNRKRKQDLPLDVINCSRKFADSVKGDMKHCKTARRMTADRMISEYCIGERNHCNLTTENQETPSLQNKSEIFTSETAAYGTNSKQNFKESFQKETTSIFEKLQESFTKFKPNFTMSAAVSPYFDSDDVVLKHVPRESSKQSDTTFTLSNEKVTHFFKNNVMDSLKNFIANHGELLFYYKRVLFLEFAIALLLFVTQFQTSLIVYIYVNFVCLGIICMISSKQLFMRLRRNVSLYFLVY